jgi:hypothetical protein
MNTMGIVNTNKHSTFPNNGNPKTFWTLYAKISPALYSLYVAKVELMCFCVFSSVRDDPVVTEATSEVLAVDAVAGRGAAGIPTGSVDAAANKAAPPKAVAAKGFAAPRLRRGFEGVV